LRNGGIAMLDSPGQNPTAAEAPAQLDAERSPESALVTRDRVPDKVAAERQ
jgi:hypothetical protein